MTYGLGIELTAAGALAVADRGTGPAPAVHVAPIVAVDETGELVAGDAAARLAAAVPSSAIADVIGQFPVDRLWLAGGCMITPDDALATILRAIASLVSDQEGGPAGAVTIGCPPTWEADVRSRVVTAASTARLARPDCVPVLDGRRAATHAAARCPVEATPPGAGPHDDLPALRPGVTARRRVDVADPHDPTATKPVRGRRPVPALAVVLGAVLAFAVAVVATGQARSDSSRVEVTLVPGRSSPEVATTVPPTDRALTLGLVTDGTGEAAVRATLAEINGVGGVLGQDVYLVVADATSADPVAELTGQGVTAIVDDSVGGLPGGAGGLATCTTGRSSETAEPISDAAGCVTFLSLASLAAGDTGAARVRRAADDLVQRQGVDCTSFVQCRGLIVAGQPVTYAGLRSATPLVRTPPTPAPQCPDRQPAPMVCPTAVPFRSPPTESPRP